MNKPIISMSLVFAAAACLAAPSMGKNHVPEALDDSIREFNEAAADRPHVLLVNVGKAVPEDAWSLSSTYAVSRLQLNVWTNSLEKLSQEQLLKDPSLTEKLFINENSKVGVYLINDKTSVPVLAAPGHWAVVNVAVASEGAPDKQTYRDRVAKLILKGIAAAAGGGATVEPKCSMFYGSNTIKGLDAANIMITPMCYFPMLEILRSAGGSDMTVPED